MISISVIMITYAHDKFIREAIEGVMIQEVDFPLELIVADDCSPDETESVIREIIENHPKSDIVKYTRHAVNKGMISNFTWALEQCKGDYIALCEGDDYWTDPLKLQKQVDFLENNQNYILHYHNCIEIINNLEIQRYWSKRHMSNFSFDYKDSIKEKMGYTLSMVFRGDYINREFLALSRKAYYPDWSLELYLLSSGLLGYYTCELMGAYRHHDGGFTKMYPQSELNFVDSKLRMLKSLKNSNLLKKDIASELIFLRKQKIKIFWSNFFKAFKNKFSRIKNLSKIK
jgi:glycosyltransferase involved in cell wall biosynthesis